LGYYERAAPVLEEIGDRATLATVLNNIGQVYSARGAYAEALGYYERAAPVLEEIGDRATLATVQSNLAALCLRAGDDIAAEAHLRRSSALFDELGLDADNAEATREYLSCGLTKGWDAARKLLAQNEESPIRLPFDAFRPLIIEELGEEFGNDSNASHLEVAEIRSGEEL
jgi:tetratricopeptide (TPR) repeat protein